MASQTKPKADILDEIIAGTARGKGQKQKTAVLLDMLSDDHRGRLIEIMSKEQTAAWSDRRIAERRLG